MNFKYKGIDYSTPVVLADIQLQQYIDFMAQYGNSLAEQKRKAEQLTDSEEKANAYLLLRLDELTQTFSFYTGIPLLEVMSNFALDPIIQVSSVTVDLLTNEEIHRDKTSFRWNGERWVLHPLVTEPTQNMPYNLYLKSKVLAGLLIDFSEGNLSVLPEICASFLLLSYEDHPTDHLTASPERIETMKQLPLDIALSVVYYLRDSFTIFQSILKEEAPDGAG